MTGKKEDCPYAGDIAFLNSSRGTIMEELKEIKLNVKEIQNTMVDFIVTANKTFSTKKELDMKANKTTVERHERLIARYAFRLITGLCGIIASLISYIYLSGK